jgi:hypothetical protein
MQMILQLVQAMRVMAAMAVVLAELAVATAVAVLVEVAEDKQFFVAICFIPAKVGHHPSKWYTAKVGWAKT